MDLSWSRISMFTRCGEQFRRRYIEGEIRPPGIALITGAATHRGVEADLTTKLKEGKLASIEEIKAEARDYVHKKFEDGDYLLSDDDPDPDTARDQCVEQSIALAECHHGSLAPSIEPASVERKWRVDVSGYPYALRGRLDIEERRESGVTLRDTKTTGRTPSKDAAHNSGQLTLYSLALKVLDGDLPECVTIDALVKNKTPKAVTRESTRSNEHCKAFLLRVARVWECIEAGHFPPADPGDWICDPRYCGYYDSCPYVTRSVHAIGGDE